MIDISALHDRRGVFPGLPGISCFIRRLCITGVHATGIVYCSRYLATSAKHRISAATSAVSLTFPPLHRRCARLNHGSLHQPIAALYSLHSAADCFVRSRFPQPGTFWDQNLNYFTCVLAQLTITFSPNLFIKLLFRRRISFRSGESSNSSASGNDKSANATVPDEKNKRTS